MPELKQERDQWRHDERHINGHVDRMVSVLVEHEETMPVAYMAIDMIYRPYLQWLHSAQAQKLDATATRNSVVHLVNMMILEICSRMTNVDRGAEHAIDWIDEFMDKLTKELDEDLRMLIRRLHGSNDNDLGNSN